MTRMKSLWRPIPVGREPDIPQPMTRNIKMATSNSPLLLYLALFPSDRESREKSSSFSAAWTAKIQQVHLPITKALVSLTRWSATNPRLKYYGCILLAFGILVSGLMTNFKIEIDDIWTPMGSMPAKHKKYIANDSGFPDLPRSCVFIFRLLAFKEA